MRAARLGWSVSPRLLLTTGLIAAAVLVLLPPFGSSDHLSYAAYGRMLVTGHNPYLTTPNGWPGWATRSPARSRTGGPAPRCYGVLATGGQALASLIGGTSVRLTVFVLSLLNLAGFAVTGLLLHRLAAGDRSPPAARGAAVDVQPAAAPGARGRRARGQPGDRVRRGGRRRLRAGPAPGGRRCHLALRAVGVRGRPAGRARLRGQAEHAAGRRRPGRGVPAGLVGPRRRTRARGRAQAGRLRPRRWRAWPPGSRW